MGWWEKVDSLSRGPCLVVGPSFVDRPFPNVGLGFQNPGEMGTSPYFTFACDEG